MPTTHRRTFVVIFALVLGWSASASTESHSVLDRAALCANTTSFASCSRSIENKLSKVFPGVFKRTADENVEVVTRSGKKVVLSSGEDGTLNVTDVIPELNLIVVSQHSSESSGFFGISTLTGKKFDLLGPLVLSPDKHKFVSAETDLDSGLSQTGIQVWRLSSTGEPVLEWSKTFGRVGPGQIHWRDAESVEFSLRRSTVTDDEGVSSEPESAATSEPLGTIDLKLINDKWSCVLSPQPNAKIKLGERDGC